MTGANSHNLDRQFLALIEGGDFDQEELWAVSFLLDLFAITGRARLTTTYERLANLMGVSVRTLRNYLAAFEKVPWLVVIRARQGPVLMLRDAAIGGNTRQYAATEVESEGVGDTDGISRQQAAIGGNTRQYAATGGDIGGAGGLVGSSDPVWGYLLLGEKTPPLDRPYPSHLPARPNNTPPNAAKCREMPPNAAKCREMPPNGASFPGTGVPSQGDKPPDAAKCREMPRNAANFRQMPPNAVNFRAGLQAAAEQVDEGTLRAVLGAAGDAFLLTEADARRALALAAMRGIPGEIVVAAALYTRWKVEREGGLKRPARYFLRLLEKDNPVREVSEQALREAREILGLEPEENVDAGDRDAGVEVEIAGDPPYDPVRVWRTAKTRLSEVLERREYNTWVKDATLLGWEEGEFVIGVANNFAKEWLYSRLSGTVTEALAHAAGVSEKDVSARYVIHVRR